MVAVVEPLVAGSYMAAGGDILGISGSAISDGCGCCGCFGGLRFCWLHGGAIPMYSALIPPPP